MKEIITLVLLQSVISSNANPRLIRLGDLPGGAFASLPLDVSDDGSVVVGVAISGQGREAFRWTEATGMVGLGDVAGGAVGSTALGVSGDGRTVVGVADDPDGGLDIQGLELGLGQVSFGSDLVSFVFGGSGVNFPFGTEKAFRWTSSTGIQALDSIPGGNQAAAFDVSDDGNSIGGIAERGSRASAIRWVVGGTPDLVAELERDDIFTVALSGDGNSGIASVWSTLFSPSGLSSLVFRGDESAFLRSSLVEAPVYVGSISRDGLYACGTGGVARFGNQFRSSALLWKPENFTGQAVESFQPFYALSGLNGVTGDSAFTGIADGAVMMVGGAQTQSGSRAFLLPGLGAKPIWLEDFLTQNGINRRGFTQMSLNGVSRDGRSLIGVGINSSNQVEGFLITGLVGIPAPDLASLEARTSNGNVLLEWDSLATDSYRIERYDPVRSRWNAISPQITGDGTRKSYAVRASGSQGIYRLRK